MAKVSAQPSPGQPSSSQRADQTSSLEQLSRRLSSLLRALLSRRRQLEQLGSEFGQDVLVGARCEGEACQVRKV